AFTLSTGVVLQLLTTAAVDAQEELARMIAADKVEDGRDSFATVLLDPTRPRWQTTLDERLFALIGFGPNWQRYVPNGAAKADAHDRHGVPTGLLVAERSFCLGDDDFAYGTSAEYFGAIGGGSGLSPEQDGEMTLRILKSVMDSVRSRRDGWIGDLRGPDGTHRWWNPEDRAGSEYVQVLTRQKFVTAALA
ncbi:MAG TPA: hypothetical protein VGR89_09415, partial [Puia sp.]|nr:hypothetical protein [Puia sp.]